MLKDDMLINCYLELHGCLQKYSQLKYIGKDHLTNLANIIIEVNIMNRHKNSPLQTQLSLYAISIAKQKLVQTLFLFETHFLSPYRAVTDKLRIIEKNILIFYQPKWQQYEREQFSQKLKQYYMALCEINCLARKLIEQYSKQMDYFQKKWETLQSRVLKNQMKENLPQEIKIMALHASYESQIEGGLIEHWGKILPGLQSKRHRV